MTDQQLDSSDISNKPRLILLAHGSSDPAWSETFELMCKDTCVNFDNASVAYMELSSPLLADVIREEAKKGYRHFKIVPLFLAAGKHLKLDIPRILNTLKEEIGISYELLPPIGTHPLMSSTIKSIVKEAVA